MARWNIAFAVLFLGLCFTECQKKETSTDAILDQAIPDQVAQAWLEASQSLTILVIGKPGAGKSSLVNGILGKKVAQEGKGVRRCTKAVQRYTEEINNVTVTVIDTPGLQDPKMKDEDTFEQIRKETGGHVDLVLFCKKMTDRIERSDQNMIQEMNKVFQRSLWDNTLLVLTFANKVDRYNDVDNAQEFEQLLQDWKDVLVEALQQHAGLSPDDAKGIPVVPAGYEDLPYCEGWRDPNKCKNWINNVFLAALERTRTRTKTEEIHAALEWAKKDSINQVSMNCMLFGLPRVGKSTLLKRFFGKLSTPNVASTGVAGAAVQVCINDTHFSDATVQVSDLKWIKVDLETEAAHLIQNILESAKTATTEQTVINTATVSSEAPATSNAGNTHQDSPDKAVTYNAGNTHQDSPDEADLPREFTDFLRECTEKHDWSEVKQALGGEPWTIHLTDTGGQPEFQQLLPALVFGPSIFFLVFRLDVDLDEFHLVEYMDSTGRSIVPYTSSYTPIDTILQSLSSVASITRMEENNIDQTKPRVFLIGTFKDKVAEEKITNIDARLQKVIKEHDKNKIVQYADSSQPSVIFTIDNLSPDETDIMRIREAVMRLGTNPLTKGDYEITTPYPWLIFGIFIRRLESSILSYEQCFTVAQQCGINTQEDLDKVLHFLHTRVGVIQYFPTEDLHDIVIKDPQYIFDKISDLIVKTFTFEKMPGVHHIPDDFTKKGIFHSDVFVKIAETSSELMTPMKFLSLLKHLHIVVPLEDETSSSNNHTTRYFMPCALSHVEAAQPSQQPSEGEPLLIVFKRGYTPQGLFGPLISYLLGKKKRSELLQWKLIEEKIFRDQITLQLTRQYSVVLRIHPTYLSAKLIQTKSESFPGNDNTTKICNDIRQSLEDGLREVSQRLQMHNPHTLSFMCPEVEENDQCHTVIVQDLNGQYLESSQNPAKTWGLSDDHCVWLPQEGTCGIKGNILMIPGLGIGLTVIVIGAFSGIFICWRRNQGKTLTIDRHTSPKPTDQLGEDNKSEITEYLERIGNNQDLLRLGEKLGLNGRKLRKRKDSDTFLDDLVGDWLERKHRVDKVGKPTWRKLVEVLRKVGQNGLANDIEKERISPH